MVRYILLAFVLAAGGTTSSFNGLNELLPVWTGADTDAGGHWDPWGGTGSNSASDAESDAGNHWDPWG
jgi:hypothetical protein